VLSALRELLGETLRGVLHLGEYHNESLSVFLKPVRQHVRLRCLGYLVHRVRNGGVSILDLHSNYRRIVLNSSSELTNLVGHRSGEEQSLSLRWELRDNLIDVWEEPHVAHPIRLVEDKVLNPFKVEGASA
jgi:hypothetical protein